MKKPKFREFCPLVTALVGSSDLELIRTFGGKTHICPKNRPALCGRRPDGFRVDSDDTSMVCRDCYKKVDPEVVVETNPPHCRVTTKIDAPIPRGAINIKEF